MTGGLQTLGLIAGGGVMPLRVADAARRAGRPVFAVLVEGFADPREWAAWPHEVVRLGAVGRMLGLLRRQGARQLVLAGRVTRPSILSLRLDGEGLRLAARVGRRALFGGDDALLTAVVTVLRDEGFEPLGAQHIFAELLIEAGCPTRAQPDAEALEDIRRGITVARQLGAADAGQGCVVQQGLVLALEAIEGTDAMIARAGEMRREGPGGVLIKLVKPAQSKLVDLPAIGPDTIRAAAAAGLRGIAVEARRNGHVGTIVLDRDTTISEANAAGLFLLAMDADHILKEGTTP
ncbi:LpxI family protein [Falsiroseomonas sp.]|uniref:LpxI family protein n=1 Tax=Falsiroseomonas sp. TaxID=2870721 RepID=UPI0027376985|nr:UDP-2,3-diacylglucosamine diphosphatase LpxI [Falsiroseomonas sp.]MDP3414737.1 UDP-2,3-diacylglucosamine diphosphatase LpxI [Falsiroseomonas sp.]